jgi:hypothetical protein
MIFYQTIFDDGLKNVNWVQKLYTKAFKIQIFEAIKFMSKSKFVHIFWALLLTMIIDDFVLGLTQQ